MQGAGGRAGVLSVVVVGRVALAALVWPWGSADVVVVVTVASVAAATACLLLLPQPWRGHEKQGSVFIHNGADRH